MSARPKVEVIQIAERASARMSIRNEMDHLADLLRTRIRPGADPRAECEPFDWQTMRHLLARRPHAIAEVTVFDADNRIVGIRCVVMDHPLARVRCVVPEDVARWRDPKHRAALTERARAYATDRVTYSWPTKSTPVP